MNTIKSDTWYMRQALMQANKGFALDEVPIGALVVAPDGTIIARAYNLVERKKSQTAHAEMLAIQKATKKMGDWRLDECTLYVTLEPCSMCMHLIMLSRIKKVIFGASSPLFGFSLDNIKNFRVYKEGKISIEKGVLAEDSAALLKTFFQSKRKTGE